MVGTLEDDGYCFVCGKSNPHGLKVSFEKTHNAVKAYFVADKKFQGYKDVVHRGIISSLLDEASVKALVMRGIKAVSAEIKLRFKKPPFVGEEAEINAYIGRSRRKMYEIYAEMKKSDEEVIAESRAKVIHYGEQTVVV